jgi:hypothetical protein
MTDLHWRRKALALKKESTKGTDPTHASTDAMLTRNLSIVPYQGNTVDRMNDKPHFGNDPKINVEPHSQITFEIEVAGAGSAADTPPAYGEALEACGFVETVQAGTSVTYTPAGGDSSDEFESAGLEFSLDGQMQAMLGSHGNLEIVINPNDFAMFKFTFLGNYLAPTAVALPTGDVSDFQVAIPVSNVNTPTCTVAGIAVVLHACTINLGNVLGVRDLPNIGANKIIIEDRKPTGSITFELPDLATKDWFTAIRSDNGHVTQAIEIIHGTDALNTVTIGAPAVQLSGMTLNESKGIVTAAFDMTFLPDAGNDDLTIVTT